MSTQVQQVNGGWVVSTIVSEGNQRKIPRIPVFIQDESLAAMQAEVKLQATAARKAFGVDQQLEEPVV